MKFLAEAKLLQKVEGRGAIITFSGADLSGANLTDAADNLSGANLSDADEQVSAVESLAGATMPNGQPYWEWLKDKKAQGKDEKNE
jgi:uncharacterized protein YjbI with pentapeptide repeats